MSTDNNTSDRTPLKEILAQARDIRWSYAVIAFCLAVTLWYTVTVRDKVESWVDVQVVFKNAPDNLVISDGLINKLSVRIRAARGLSRVLTNREASVVVDLSQITKGTNAIAVKREMLPFNAAYEVIQTTPSRIVIVADTRTTRELALETYFSGKLPPDLFVKAIRVNPDKVTVSGAESLIAGVSRVRLPVPLATDTPSGHSTVTVAVPMPSSVAIAPPQVSVELEVGVRTRQVKFTRAVTPVGPKDGPVPAVQPEKVAIVANIPESIAKDEKKMAEITATVTVPQEIGEQAVKLPVSVTLPDNAGLVSVTPVEVSVSFPAPK